MAVGKGIFPPESPEDGEVFTVAGMDFIWVASANRWMKKATGEMILPAMLRVIATLENLKAATHQLYPPN